MQTNYKRLGFAALVLAQLSWAGTAAAQEAKELIEPGPRQGYYFGIGTRSGLFAAEDHKLGGLGALLGGGFALRFGQLTDNNIGVGLGLEFGGGSNDDWVGGYGALVLEGHYRLIDTLPVALRGSVGLATGGFSRADPNAETSKDDPDRMFGALFTAGVSYDVFPWWKKGEYDSGDPGLTFFLEGKFLSGGDTNMGCAFFGIEFSYYSGFQKSRLKLPIEKAFTKDD